MYKILVVDDEKRIREIIKKYAVFEGNTIVEAEDGMKAIEMCRNCLLYTSDAADE